MSNYKPLTPDLRRKINDGIDRNIDELKTCQNNGFVNAQIDAWEMMKNMIKALPDGCLMPLKENKR